LEIEKKAVDQDKASTRYQQQIIEIERDGLQTKQENFEYQNDIE